MKPKQFKNPNDISSKSSRASIVKWCKMNNQFCGSIAIPRYSASPISKHQSIPPDSARILLQRHVYFDPGAALMVRLDTWMWLALNTTWTKFWLYDLIMLYVQAFSNMFSSVCFCSFVATHTAQPPMTPHWSRPQSSKAGPLGLSRQPLKRLCFS